MGLELPVWDVSTVGLTVATLGLVGASVLDRFLDDDGSDDDGGMGGDDDVFGGGMGGGDGGGGGGMGGGMGGGGGGGMGGGGGGGGDGFDDFDGMDEWDDDFDDGGGGGGANTDELENRLDDLEAEVATLSSTVSTVRSENEEISEAVDDIEEDVRNLLDIYEMVTRGINPFVDDSSGFEGVGGGEDSFGLFDDDEGDEPAEEALDDDVASADADGFFDEELVEPDDGGFDEMDDPDDADDADDELGDDLDEEFDESLDDEFDGSLDDTLDDELDDELDDGGSADAASETEPADDGDDMNDDAKSFSELKEEYDAGEADWADEAGGETAADDDPFEDDGDALDELGDAPEDAGSLDDDFGAEAEDAPEAERSDGVADSADDDAGRSPAAGGRGPVPGGDPADSVDDGFEYVGSDDLSGSGRKPYLTELPADYVGDLLVMEWLEFLVSESDVTDAVRAIQYYERIEWVGADAAARLRDFLSGFGTVDRNLIDRPGTDELVREHHTRSLRYITQLNGTSSHTVLLDRWEDLAAGSLVGGGPPAPRRGGRRGRAHAPDRRSNGESAHERSNGHRDRGLGSRFRRRVAPTDDRSGSAPRHGDPADGGWGDGR